MYRKYNITSIIEEERSYKVGFRISIGNKSIRRVTAQARQRVRINISESRNGITIRLNKHSSKIHTLKLEHGHLARNN